MDLADQVTIREFLNDRERLIGGTIVFWDYFFPLAPVRAEILEIEEVCHEGCDYKDIVIRTNYFFSAVAHAVAPVSKYQDFSFMTEPLHASICNACAGMWVIAISGKGVVHLHFHE